MAPIINNTREQQFEVESNGLKATLTYRFYKRDIALMHTSVPEGLSGMGIATVLAKEAFAYAKATKKPVMVYCPFVAGFVKKHPEYEAQLDPEYYTAKR